MAGRDEIRSLNKALRAITYLNRQADCTVSLVAAGIEVPRATAYRLLTTLASEGHVDKLPNSDIYRLTSLVRGLVEGFRDAELLIELAVPLLVEAQRELGWSNGLSTPGAPRWRCASTPTTRRRWRSSAMAWAPRATCWCRPAAIATWPIAHRASARP